jgi:glycine/D-amino acid oxidase-like deaminating enzyme
VVGAGVIGAACAYELTRHGMQTLVVDRGQLASGTTSSGEGNLLVSDKPPGPELDLALLSLRRWRILAKDIPCEYEPKGGLVVARSVTELTRLADLAEHQRACGVQAQDVDRAELHRLEPALTRACSGGVFYPQDAQLNPMLATAHLLAAARSAGARLITGAEVVGLRRVQAPSGSIAGFPGLAVTLRTDQGVSELRAAHVVNAAGTWAQAVADLGGVRVPVLPRRGIVLVIAGMPGLVRHKVYAADYVADVASAQADLESSPVVEGTPSGTLLVGASRERVGFDPRMPVTVIQRLAAQAVELFPALARARLLRTYRGYRPYCPDHLPVIGPDPRLPGLHHACGHEGAGIGLAAGTAQLIAQSIAGQTPSIDLGPFRPERFTEES